LLRVCAAKLKHLFWGRPLALGLAEASPHRPHGSAGIALGNLDRAKLVRTEIDHGIEELLPDLYLEMQMGARRSARAADEGYGLSSLHLLTGTDQNAAQVGIVGEHVPSMVDEHRVSVAPIPFSASDEDHGSPVAGMNRIPFVGLDVEAAVENSSAETESGGQRSCGDGKVELRDERMLPALHKARSVAGNFVSVGSALIRCAAGAAERAERGQRRGVGFLDNSRA